MKKILILLLFFNLLIFNISNAQCREFIESVAETELEPYIMDGNFQAVVLSEGDSIEMLRTFLSGQNYRIAVTGMDMFTVDIKVIDTDGKVVFTNQTADGSYQKAPDKNSTLRKWDFKPEKSQNLKIRAKVIPISTGGNYKMEGCLGILTGFKL